MTLLNKIAKINNQNLRFILIFGLIVLIQLLIKGTTPINYLQEGYPPGKVILTAQSIWNNGTIEVAKFKNYYDLAINESTDFSNSIINQDIFSIGKNGELYPKHAILSAFISAPFYGLFGDLGFIYLSFLILFIIVYTIYSISNEFTVRNSGIFVLGILIFTSIFTPFAKFSFSYDLQLVAFTLLGLKLLKLHPLLGAALASSTIFIKPSNILIIPFLLIARLPNKDRFVWLFKSVAMLTFFIILFAFYNYYLYGSFFTTSYHRAPYFMNGQYFFEANRPTGFDYNILLSNWYDKLFDSNHGLLVKNLPILFLLPAIPYFARTNKKLFFYSLIMGGGLLTCYYFSYPVWPKRYFYVPIGLFSIVVIVFLCNITRSNRYKNESV